MATDYVNLVDLNKNGMIEKDEYMEFFNNFDGISLEEEEVEALFKEADKDDSG